MPRKLQHENCCQSVSNTAHYIHFMVVSKLRLNKVSMVCIILCVLETKWTGTCTHTYHWISKQGTQKRGGGGYSCMLLSTWQLHYNYRNQILVLSCNTANYENFHYNGWRNKLSRIQGHSHPKSMRKGSKENANRSGLLLWLVSTAK